MTPEKFTRDPLNPETGRPYTEAEIISALKGMKDIDYSDPVAIGDRTPDYENFLGTDPIRNEDTKYAIKNIVDRLSAYLSGPMIVDIFERHQDRMDWQNAFLIPKFGTGFLKLWRENRMRLDKMAGVKNAMILLDLNLKKVDTEKARQTRGLIADFPDISAYGDTMSLENRKRFVTELTRRSKEFIELVTIPVEN